MTLEQFCRDTLLVRPRLWNCAAWALSALGVKHPATAAFVRERWPAYKDYREGAAEFARRDIYSAADFCDAMIVFSEGRLVATSSPSPGDLAFACTKQFNGVGFPTVGVVVDEKQCAFLGMRGSVERVDTARLRDFARAV